MKGKNASELVNIIEQKDRRFKIAQTIFMAMIAVAVIVLMIMQNRAIDQFSNQSRERSKGLTALQKSNAEENAKQTRYIQCIAQFFATTDRTNLVITDLDKCNFLKNGEAIPGLDVTPTNSTDNSTPKATSTTPTTGSSATPTTPATQTPSQPTTPSNPSTPENDTPPPVTIKTPIVDIPLCVPLLDLCVR